MTATVRFGTWNILDGGIDGNVEFRREKQIEILTALRFDVLAVQELKGWEQGNWWRLYELADACGMKPLPPVTSHVGDGRNHMALLYRPETVRVRDFTPDHGKGAFHHGLGRARMRINNTELCVLMTHLAWVDGDKRLAEARWLTDYAGSFPGTPGKAVLLGDLNVISNDDPEPDWDEVPTNLHARYRLVQSDGSFGAFDRRAMQVLLNAGWVDPQSEVDSPREPTVGHWYPNEPVRQHFDHVLTAGGISTRSYWTHDTSQTRVVSDHLPTGLDAEVA